MCGVCVACVWRVCGVCVACVWRVCGECVAHTCNTLGRWTKAEHLLFLSGLRIHGKEWKRVASHVQTRTVVQTRTHAQKYFQKVMKGGEGEDSATAHGVLVESGSTAKGKGKRKSKVRTRCGGLFDCVADSALLIKSTLHQECAGQNAPPRLYRERTARERMDRERRGMSGERTLYLPASRLPPSFTHTGLCSHMCMGLCSHMCTQADDGSSAASTPNMGGPSGLRRSASVTAAEQAQSVYLGMLGSSGELGGSSSSFGEYVRERSESRQASEHQPDARSLRDASREFPREPFIYSPSPCSPPINPRSRSPLIPSLAAHLLKMLNTRRRILANLARSCVFWLS